MQPILIFISNRTATQWILLAYVITGLFLWNNQAYEIVINHRRIGLSRECILFCDVLVDFSVAALGLYGFYKSKENYIYPIVYTRPLRIAFYCTMVLSTTILFDDSENSQLTFEDLISKVELLGTDYEKSLKDGDRFLSVAILASLVYLIKRNVTELTPHVAAIIYEIYFVICIVFQGLLIVVIMSHISHMKRIKMTKFMLAWVSRRHRDAAEGQNLHGDESSIDSGQLIVPNVEFPSRRYYSCFFGSIFDNCTQEQTQSQTEY